MSRLNRVTFDDISGVCHIVGEGNPASAPGIAAPVGSTYVRRDGASGAVMYFKFGSNAVDWEAAGASGAVGAHTHSAADITSGTLADARLSTNVPLKSSTNVFSVQQYFERATPTDVAIFVGDNGDSTYRFALNAGGKMDWGPGGTVARDTTLERTGVGALTLTGSLAISGSLTIGGATPSMVGHAHSGADITTGTVADGRLSTNVALKSAANVFALEQYVQRSVAGWAWATRIGAESQWRHIVDTSGKHEWGPGGTVARDTALYRTAPGELRIDNVLRFGASAGEGTISGPESDLGVYGSLRVNGAQNGYAGIQFGSVGRTLMFAADVQGSWTGSVWQWYFRNGVLEVGQIPADRVSAGTFATGNFTFQADLQVGTGIGVGRTYGGSTGIEIGNDTASGATPFIDFHYGGGVVQDYSARIIALGSNSLTVAFADNNGTLGVGGDVSANGDVYGRGLRLPNVYYGSDTPGTVVTSPIEGDLYFRRY